MACKNEILSQISPCAQRSIAGHQLHVHVLHGPSQDYPIDGTRSSFPFLGHCHLSILSFSCLLCLSSILGELPCARVSLGTWRQPVSCSFCLGFPRPACPCCHQVDTCRDKHGVVPHSPGRHEGLSAPQPSLGRGILLEGSCYQPPARAGPVSNGGSELPWEEVWGWHRPDRRSVV